MESLGAADVPIWAGALPALVYPLAGVSYRTEPRTLFMQEPA